MSQIDHILVPISDKPLWLTEVVEVQREGGDEYKDHHPVTLWWAEGDDIEKEWTRQQRRKKRKEDREAHKKKDGHEDLRTPGLMKGYSVENVMKIGNRYWEMAEEVEDVIKKGAAGRGEWAGHGNDKHDK